MPRVAPAAASRRTDAVAPKSRRAPATRSRLRVVPPAPAPAVSRRAPARVATAVRRLPARDAAPAVTYSKDQLLARFAPLVRHVVERIATTLPRNVDHEDLYSAGVLGLLDAHAK